VLLVEQYVEYLACNNLMVVTPPLKRISETGLTWGDQKVAQFDKNRAHRIFFSLCSFICHKYKAHKQTATTQCNAENQPEKVVDFVLVLVDNKSSRRNS